MAIVLSALLVLSARPFCHGCPTSLTLPYHLPRISLNLANNAMSAFRKASDILLKIASVFGLSRFYTKRRNDRQTYRDAKDTLPIVTQAHASVLQRRRRSNRTMRVKPANLCSIGPSASTSDDDYNLF